MSENGPKHLPQPAGLLFNNKAYDLIKFLALVLLPAIGTLYFGIAAIWGLPHAEEVVGTILVVDTFLGGLIGITATQYKNSDARFDGRIDVSPGEEPDTTNMNVSLSPDAIEGKDEVVIKVNKV